MTRPHLLVVDDEPLNLEIIKEYLDDKDYDAVFVESGEAAWSQLETTETPFELVILDRMMPGMNGMELLRRMKADVRFRDIPVVMQTAASTPDQVREGIEAGAYYYLAKPYQPETLAAIVRAALHDVVMRKTAVRRASDHVRAMSMLDRAEFRFRRVDEIGPLIEVLTGLCPAPEVAAIGIPDERSGEAVKIFVVRKDPNLTAEALVAHCREFITSYKVPHHVEFRTDLPKTNVGKILRRALREPAK